MDNKIGLFWLRDDFRFVRNDGLIEATHNHDNVVVFYLYNEIFVSEVVAPPAKFFFVTQLCQKLILKFPTRYHQHLF